MTSSDEDHQRRRAQGRLVAICSSALSSRSRSPAWIVAGWVVALGWAGPQVIALVLVARKVHRTPSRPAGP
jgi:hypothetical protein